jgi:hypothetical protein
MKLALIAIGFPFDDSARTNARRHGVEWLTLNRVADLNPTCRRHGIFFEKS